MTTVRRSDPAPRRAHLGARDLLLAVLDEDSFRSWDEPITPPAGASPDYLAELAEARAASGVDEAVLTGSGTIDGRRVAVVVSEFRFLAGSVGVACAERIEAAVRRATKDGLPLLAAPASGGTRMQEGTAAFVEMIRITAAIGAHRGKGLPYLVYLRHPTMGGVFASWGSLGHITVAEPGALLGFIGPKVYAALHGVEFPQGIQRAENLARKGIIDAVVAPGQLKELAARALRVLAGTAGPITSATTTDAPDTPAWDSIQRTRDPRRPGVRDVLRHAASDTLPLSGTSEGEHQPGLVTALANLGGVPCVVVGQDRHAQRLRGPLGPATLREARRCIRLAAELGLPLVTFIDTPGASLSAEAEEGGLSGEIARCLAELLELPSPTVAVLLGEGGGGGALALLPADRVVAAAHA
ncbi:MAG TPA: carboxyl transferase domain-containing protein, partial [Pseudonocardiaceae bacterium]|nr:carboxyl transferase domain-containing protein [Pseudonocardiaceae bacterium]